MLMFPGKLCLCCQVGCVYVGKWYMFMLSGRLCFMLESRACLCC